jgi:hypothetical protein
MQSQEEREEAKKDNKVIIKVEALPFTSDPPFFRYM